MEIYARVVMGDIMQSGQILDILCRYRQQDFLMNLMWDMRERC